MALALLLAVYVLGVLSGYAVKSVTIPATVAVGASGSGSTTDSKPRHSGLQSDGEDTPNAPDVDNYQPSLAR